MNRRRLNSVKHAGLFLALFAFGMVSVGLKTAQASPLSLGAFQSSGWSTVIVTPVIPVIAAPSGAIGLSLGGAPNQGSVSYGGFAPRGLNAFSVFGFGSFSGTSTLTAVSALGFTNSVAGSTTAPLAAGPPSNAPVLNAAPIHTAAPTLDPEPASIFLFGSGLVAVFAVGRRRLAHR